MGITTDKIMEALAREINMKIIKRTSAGIYTLVSTNPILTEKILIWIDEKTGVLTSNVLQDVMSEKFNRIAGDMWDEYMGN